LRRATVKHSARKGGHDTGSGLLLLSAAQRTWPDLLPVRPGRE
jgi:hypothetical protein